VGTAQGRSASIPTCPAKALIADLGCGPVGLDTAVFIYFIVEHPRFLPVVSPVFSAVASARLTAITSGVT